MWAVVLGPSGGTIARLRTNGRVTAAASDGHGGWFVGGSFTRVDGVRRLDLVHLRASGAVDRRWLAQVSGHLRGYDFDVSGIALVGRRVFVAGTFSRADHRPVAGLAAFDLTTGALDPRWRPPVGGGALIGIVPIGKHLVLAGSFAAGGARGTRYDLVAVDGSTGALVSAWQPRLRPAPSPSSFGEVEAVVVAGNTLYAIGSFRVGANRSGFVAIDRRSGRVRPAFRPPPLRSGQFLALGATSSRVFVSGSFHELGGYRRPGLAALDPRTGAIVPGWRPAVRGGSFILADRSRVLVGGVALDPRTGARIHGWSFHAMGAIPLALSGSRALVAYTSQAVYLGSPWR